MIILQSAADRETLMEERWTGGCNERGGGEGDEREGGGRSEKTRQETRMNSEGGEYGEDEEEQEKTKKEEHKDLEEGD